MPKIPSFIEFFQRRILSSQPGMWVAIGLLIGISAGVGSLILYNGIRLFTYLVLFGISGFNPPLPGGEGGSAIYNLGSYSRYLIPVSTTLGGFFSGYLVYKFTPGTEGLGINSAVNAFHNLTVRIKNRTPAVKLLSSAVNIGAGGSAGRDGPVALISAVFGSYLASLFRLDDHDRRIVMASAIGAGIGSIFMAPIGGAIMSTEILYKRDFEVEALIPATIASVVGYAIFGYQFHYNPLFTTAASSFLFLDGRSVIVYALIGILAGFGGRFYIRIFDLVHIAFIKLRRVPAYVKPAIGGLLVGGVALFYPQVLGLGYGWVQLILSGNLYYTPLKILLLLFFLKIIATSFSIGSGGSGGAFAPSIVTGAFLGASIGILAHPLFPFVTVDEVTIVTMIAFFAGVSKTPVSMLIMGTEMAGGLDLFLPLMIAITISYFSSGVRDSIYSEQVLDRLHSPAHLFEYRDQIMDSIHVREAMKKDYIEVNDSTEVWDLAYRMRVRHSKGAVVTHDGMLAGYVSSNMLSGYRKEAHRKLSDVKLLTPVTVQEDDTLHKAIDILPADPQENVVVLRESGTGIVGTLGFNEIADAYEKSYREFKISQMKKGEEY